ncbi:MAG: right-handed parallel beta-helix repeat-containing protein [Actinomycetota bacterium]|nr:right-handed parallel beta-helix repeat-containing protein [Actinomycetota bacterium]
MTHGFSGAVSAASFLTLLALTLAGCSQSSPRTATSTSPAAAGSSRSASGGASAGPAGSNPAGSNATAAAVSCHPSGSSVKVSVASGSALKNALSHAQPGEEIALAPGTYVGNFTASHSGTATAPITLCGSRGAVLNGGDISHGYTLYLDHVSWWRVEGFTVEGGQKGVVADGSDNDLIDGLYVHSTGDEGIHLRAFSSHDTVSHCLVRDTGRKSQFFGEGIYVGSAHKNWCRYSHCQPDASNDDIIADNNIAGSTAENVDIKEGTTGGQITGNTFNGAGMVDSAATAWVNVKGNDWTITGNTGIDSSKDGFQVHQVYPGWGTGNTFRGNTAQVNGPGDGFYVQNKRLQTVVSCDNEVRNAGRGFSTIACRPA